jgi:hypothetical protein
MSKRQCGTLVQSILANGCKADIELENTIAYKRAKELTTKMPADIGDRTTYIRNLAGQVKSGRLDYDIFKLFIKLTNSWSDLLTLEK